MCIAARSQSFADIERDQILISGSSTVHNFVFYNHLNKWREKIGHDFDVVSSNSGRGILALINGETDIAAISSNFLNIADKLSQDKNIHINPDDYIIHPISQTKIVFIVHPDNPIHSLNQQQIKDIFTGKITKWDQLGIKKLGDIKIVIEHPTGGMYNIIFNEVTKKKPFIKDKIMMQNAPQIAIVVSQLPNSLGFLSDATPIDQRRGVHVLDGYSISQSMAFVTRKEDLRSDVHHIIQTITDEY